MEPVYLSVKSILFVALKALGWKVHEFGTENIPTTGAAVIASNHVSYLDFIFVGYGARSRGRYVRFMAKKEIFDHKIAGPLMRGMKHLPVDRFGAPAEAIQAGVAALLRGELVGMFPEGTISRSFVPRPGKTGSARMAIEAGVPLIPCAVWGGQRVLTKGRPKDVQRNVAIAVEYGPAVEYAAGEDAGVVTERLTEAIATLTDKLQRTYPQLPASADERWWLPAHLGGTAPTIEEADAMAARDREVKRARRAERAGEPTGR
ncbi:MAG: lysophospholipid acyltransferase family protein [Actinomycetota bacterium]